MQWVIEITIAMMGIGITTILGIQIWNALTIDKLIDSRLRKEREVTQKEITSYYSKTKHIASSLSSFNLAFTFRETGQLSSAFHAYMQAIISANAAGAEDICEMYAEWLSNLLIKAAQDEVAIKITPEQRLEYISELANLTSKRFLDIKKVLIGENTFTKCS